MSQPQGPRISEPLATTGQWATVPAGCVAAITVSIHHCLVPKTLMLRDITGNCSFCCVLSLFTGAYRIFLCIFKVYIVQLLAQFVCFQNGFAQGRGFSWGGGGESVDMPSDCHNLGGAQA